MSKALEFNVLHSRHTRYIPTREDLEEVLRNEYGEEIDFQIEHFNERWHFYAPGQVSEVTQRKWAEDIDEKYKKAAGKATTQKNNAEP